jgi:von Willebrand factor type A domain-containing protein
MIFLNRKIIILLLLCLSVLSRQTLAWNILTDDLDVSCQQVAKILDCKYRMLDPKPAPSINAKSNDTSLQVIEKSQYPESDDVTAILFLVDTSDPGRKNVIEKNKTHIKELLIALKPHHKVGLASFDKSLTIKSPVGTSTFLLSKSLDSLTATGKTTELYRNLLKAIEHLKSFEAQRRVIVLLSDGQAEDKAYFHSDIIKIARESGIIINSIGYPRSVALSVALQTLRRLSEETGGSYIETDMTYNLPSNYLKAPFTNIDNGGQFTVKLDSLYQDDPPHVIKLVFNTKAGVK